MEHQQTQGGGERAPLGVDHNEEVAMSQVVGIDVGAYKHAAAVCRSGEVKPGLVGIKNGLAKLLLARQIELADRFEQANVLCSTLPPHASEHKQRSEWPHRPARSWLER